MAQLPPPPGPHSHANGTGGRIAAYDDFMYDNDEEGLDDGMNSYYSSGHQRDSVSGGGGGGGVSMSDMDDPSGTLPDHLLLAHYCSIAIMPRNASEEARQEADESWEPVREWLRTHQADEVKSATEQLGESNMTALHFACRNVPPRDVIEVFLSIAREVAEWPDSFGWLPIHYACACGADPDVIRNLADAFPDSKTTVDRRGRTPLHFALGSSTPERPVSPAVVVLLSSSGAASYADDNGMLPLHYACAYGASEDALYVLTDAFPEGITTVDRRGRIPLHFALSNAGRKASPATVRLLLSLNRDIANSINGGPLPLRVLVDFARSIRKRAGPEQKESVGRCLEHLLEARPDPTPDFFTALQMLPDWASETAVVMPVLQEVLNEKISQRFPTAVIMLDFYFLAIILITYHIRVVESIKLRGWPYNPFINMTAADYAYLDHISGGSDIVAVPGARLIPLYMGASYFFLREVVQVVSLISLNSVHLWVYSPGNWVNIAFFVVLVFWAAVMQRGLLSPDQFRTGVTFSASIIWMKLLVYLRNVLIEFAVFVGGVLYVLRSLAAFFVASFIVLIAFVQIFVTVHQATSYCNNQSVQDYIYLANLQCDNGSVHRWCSYWNAFLGVFSMLVKNLPSLVDASPGVTTDQSSAPVMTGGTVTGKVTFVIFYFVAVILLANILIGIVTATYKVIQQQRAAIVFWSNRLDFVAEMDIIAHGPWKSRLKQLLGMVGGQGNGGRRGGGGGHTFGKEFWKRLMDLFEDEMEPGVTSSEYLCYVFIRGVTALIIIPLWMALGVLSAGWLWPPQVRAALFTSSVKKTSTVSEQEDELRKTAVKMLESEVKEFHYDVAQELAMGRTQVVQMKSQVADRKQEISNEMKHVKRLITMLFEQQASLDA